MQSFSFLRGIPKTIHFTPTDGAGHTGSVDPGVPGMNILQYTWSTNGPFALVPSADQTQCQFTAASSAAPGTYSLTVAFKVNGSPVSVSADAVIPQAPATGGLFDELP